MQSVRKILLYLVLFFLSCKKDYVKLDYPSTYHKWKKETSPVRVFTHNGEIKQSAIVNRYATVDSTWFVYYRDALDSIKLIDQQNALIVEGYSSLKFNLAISGNDIRFS